MSNLQRWHCICTTVQKWNIDYRFLTWKTRGILSILNLLCSKTATLNIQPQFSVIAVIRCFCLVAHCQVTEYVIGYIMVRFRIEELHSKKCFTIAHYKNCVRLSNNELKLCSQAPRGKRNLLLDFSMCLSTGKHRHAGIIYWESFRNLHSSKRLQSWWCWQIGVGECE